MKGEAMSDQSANSDQQIARAEDIVNEIKQESRGLEKLGFPWRKPLLPLKHKTIRGCLDLNSIIHPEFIGDRQDGSQHSG
jgi:hypothetical protein